MIFGIDVSSYQTNHINFALVAETNHFVIVKVTEGDAVKDPDALGDLTAARAAGLLVGIYHFAHPELGDGATQCQKLFDACGDTMPDLPPMLDLESRKNTSAKSTIQFVSDFIAKCKELFGRSPMIYTGGWFWNTLAGDAAADIAACPFVAAQYSRGNDWTPAPTDHPTILKPWNDWTMWQFSGGAKVPGVPDLCDRDCFNGNSDQLRELCGFPPI